MSDADRFLEWRGKAVRTAAVLGTLGLSDAERRPNAKGVVIGCSDAHGFCLKVRHAEGGAAFYNPEELTKQNPEAPDGWSPKLSLEETKSLLFRWFLCDCGEPKCALSALTNLLVMHEERRILHPDQYGNGNKGRAWLLLYMLSNIQIPELGSDALTEHGGSVFAGWPTSSGAELLRLISHYGLEELTK